ncbi:MAG: UDP-N-acetylmuramoyl-tripeptide--D-alanyl-D-alanine ligase [Coriobacteriia bacterium]|nr:UDP-N-acetylmuramoyl-tripeptide--D-alanyl-D-alanine ligase [Coriobacteriia bacterium]
MQDYYADDIAQICEGTILCGSERAVARSCFIDSRDVLPGSLFAAFVGARVDGHDFLTTAVEGGASIALVSRDDLNYEQYADSTTIMLVADVLTALQKLGADQRSRLSCPVIGITGSSGKTSTKELLKGALDACYGDSDAVVATQGNYNNELGVPLTLLRADENTAAIIVEMGMRGLGQITELFHIAQPTISIITTIGDAHVEMLGSRANIARAKGEIFEALESDQLAFMPQMVDYGDYLHEICPAILQTVFVEQAQGAPVDLQAPVQQPIPACIIARVTGFDSLGHATALVKLPQVDSELSMTMGIPGEHSVQNALLALAVTQSLGFDAHVAIKGIEAVQPADMRMQRRDLESCGAARDVSILVDCYNANPESTAASLKTLSVSQLKDNSTGLRIAVLGDMLELGQHSAKAHKDVLLLAGLLNIDLVYTLGPAYEQATQDVLRELATGRNLSDIPELRSFVDAGTLIRSLTRAVTTGSLVLVKGSRGMYMEHIVDALSEEKPPGDQVRGDTSC